MYDPAKLESLLEPRPAAAPVELTPYTLPHLIAWLEKMPADISYDWDSCWTCLFGRYATDIGAAPHPARLLDTPYHTAFATLGDRLGGRRARMFVEEIAVTGSRTYGAALERARAMAAQ